MAEPRQMTMSAREFLGVEEKDGKLRAGNYVTRQDNPEIHIGDKTIEVPRGTSLVITPTFKDKEGKETPYKDKDGRTISFTMRNEPGSSVTEATDSFKLAEKELLSKLNDAIARGRKDEVTQFGYDAKEADKLIAQRAAAQPGVIRGVFSGEQPAPGAPGAPEIAPKGVHDESEEERKKHTDRILKESGAREEAANANPGVSEDEAWRAMRSNFIAAGNPMMADYMALKQREKDAPQALLNEVDIGMVNDKGEVVPYNDKLGRARPNISMEEIRLLGGDEDKLKAVRAALDFDNSDHVSKDEFMKVINSFKEGVIGAAEVKALEEIVVQPPQQGKRRGNDDIDLP